MIDISVSGIEKYYGANLVLEDINFEIQSEDRIGIVGKNGCGKTTLFKIMCKIENYDKGSLSIRKGAKLGYLPQDNSVYNGFIVEELLYTGFESINKLKHKMDELMLNIHENLEEYGHLEEQYSKLGAYEVEEKIKRVVEGLKIEKVLLSKKFETLSGGEKSRVVLGKTLLETPDVLLLDEPTNHLDINTIEWLEEFLKGYKGSVVIISHDRYFLDRVITKVVEISYGTNEIYFTNFSNYLVEKKEKFERQLEAYQNQQKQIKKMEDAIRRFRHWGSNGDNDAMFKKAKNMEKRIEKLDKIEIPKDGKKINMNFSKESNSSKRVLKVTELSKSFEDKKLFENISFEIVKNERVALLGKNGSGKTTLIKMILENNNEKITLAENIKIAYLDQVCDFEEKDMELMEYLFRETNLKEDELRPILARYQFYAEDVGKKLSSLSGGEKSRLKLLVMITNGCNFLVLDEPTNHLDIEFKEVFEKALNNFDGTILLISHDRYFLNNVVDRILEINNGKMYDYLGDYEYYKEKKIEDFVEVLQEKKEYIKETKKLSNNAIQKLEKDIKSLEESLENYNKLLETETDYIKLSEILKVKNADEHALDILLEQWMDLEM